MSAVDVTCDVKAQADKIVFEHGLDALLRSYGTVFYTGSYLLDVMAWGDIDVSMVLDPNPQSVEDFFDLGLQLAGLEGVYKMSFLNTCRHPVENLPIGYYWGMGLRVGPGVPWKIDLWAMSAEQLAHYQAMMGRIADAMTPEARRLILDVKRALLTPEGRTPPMSGYPIYEAVLFEGMKDLDDIRAYLREKGVLGA